MSITHAMILAAGRGERMRPLTDHTPKSLLQVKGITLIDRHLAALSRAGFRNVVINLGHLGEKIKAHVGDGRRFDLSIRYSQEPPGALETAGGIALAQPWIDPAGKINPAPFLVINADVFTEWPAEDAQAMATDLLHHQAKAHLLLIANPSHNTRGDFGLAASPGWLEPKSAASSLTFAGIGVYDPVMFDALIPGTKAPLAPMLHALISARACRATQFNGLWVDVGTPERLAFLNQ